MNTLTKEQLVKAVTEYYKQYQEAPDTFADYSEDPAEDAINAVEYIFEIAAQQNQGAQQ
jgi:hypothetical protein